VNTKFTPNSDSPDVSRCFNRPPLYPCIHVPDNSSGTQRRLHQLVSRSLHPGGVHGLFCDGSVQFVTDEIELVVWRAMSTIRGEEAISRF
jgi:prepilin-type processing-associated H-X9-DG protein